MRTTESSHARPSPPLKAVEKTKRPQIRFLHQIFGIMLVTGQPTRQVVGGVQMRNHGLLEQFALARFE